MEFLGELPEGKWLQEIFDSLPWKQMHFRMIPKISSRDMEYIKI